MNDLPVVTHLVIGKRQASPNPRCYIASAALLVASIKLEDSQHRTRGFGEPERIRMSVVKVEMKMSKGLLKEC